MLGGRYLLGRRLEVGSQTSTWQARDQTLDRQVHLRAVENDHPHAEAVLDAARRACAVEDPRLVRVLDVGRDADTTYIVGEWLPTPCLADQLAAGPLPAEVARTIVGEAALALETARHRGLHHLRLTPESVHLLDDGTVRVTNLATAAALDGMDPQDGDAATQHDTHDLVAVCYAALTGTWPLATASALPPAPRVGCRPVPPAQLVGGIPADLDALCTQAFSGLGPPRTPGELASQIAPWGNERVDLTPGAFPHEPAPAQTAVLAPVTAPLGVSPSRGARRRPAATNGRPPFDQNVEHIDQDSINHDRIDEHSYQPSPQPSYQQAEPQAARTSVLQALGVELPDTEGRVDRKSGTRAQSRTVLLLVVGFVAVFLLLAYCGLRGLSGGGHTPVTKPSRGTTASPSPSSTEPASPSPSTVTPTPTAAAVTVVSGRGFDPEGDGSEKDRDAAKAFDGDPATSWTSQTYRSVEFGGLKKGVGVLLDLGGPHRVTQVRLALPAGPQTVQLRTADGDKLGATVLASASDASGMVTLQLKEPIQASQLVVWFTRPAAADGGYRASVSEVAVS